MKPLRRLRDLLQERLNQPVIPVKKTIQQTAAEMMLAALIQVLNTILYLLRAK
jgi:hypothetical protein